MLSDSRKKLGNNEQGIVLMGVVIVFLIVGVINISTMVVSSGESFMVPDTQLNLTTFVVSWHSLCI